MSYKIIVDLSHNERLEEFPEFSLGEDAYEVEYIDKNEGPIDFEVLEDFDILFLGNIQHVKNNKGDKFTPKELQAIKKFVGDGGGLLLTSGSGGDQDVPMTEGSIRVLYKISGVRRFWNGTILESPSNYLVKKKNLLISELFAHPITKGINELVFPDCTFFEITEEDVDDIIVCSPKAEFKYSVDNQIGQIGPVPIGVASKFYNGRCITLGSSDIFIEDSDYGIDAGENMKFIQRVIKWLAFEL